MSKSGGGQDKSGAASDQVAASNQASSAMVPGGENLDKIRDILFGHQVTDLDAKIAKTHERLEEQIRETGEESRRRLDSLEGFVRSEFKSLSERLDAERTAREEESKNLSTAMTDFAKGLESRIKDVDTRAEESRTELRHQLLEQTKQLRDEVREGSATLRRMLESEVEQLGADKTDRRFLSDLLAELSLRLQEGPKATGGKPDA
ncbi:MAG: hypothetical protein AAGD00_06795 [Planctomycetota bacterium]